MFEKRVSMMLVAVLGAVWGVGASERTVAQIDFSDPWTVVAQRTAPGNAEGLPSEYLTLTLDQVALESTLTAAPTESAEARSGTIITLPDPDGERHSFSVRRAEIFEPALAARYPEIAAYIGEATDGSGDTARFEMSPSGFRAQVASVDGWWYVDQVTYLDSSLYMSYLREHRAGDVFVEEGVLDAAGRLIEGDHDTEPSGDLAADDLDRRRLDERTNGTQLRTVRLAVSADSTYSTFHGGNVSDVLMAINTTINRVNGITTTDLSLTFQIVGSNDDVIFLNDGGCGGSAPGTVAGPNCDPFSASNGGNLSANQLLLDNIIGDANYDLGHVFVGLNCGLASLASVGVTGRKAQGCSGLPTPQGDRFGVDYVTHEIGHQLGARHTFNGCPGQPGNRSPIAAYEPGSATTVMGYAGICGDDDVQIIGEATGTDFTGASDPYYHVKSIDEILDVTTGGGAGDVGAAPSGNAVPSASAGFDGTIPTATPFRLTGVGEDTDGDPLTHTWEQYDLGVERKLDNPQVTAGPLFRSQPPASSPSRFLPKLSSLASGNHNLAITCPASSTANGRVCWSEFVSDQGRSMNFKLTVRDGNGGAATDEMVVTAHDYGAPFEVTSPNGAESYLGASSQTVTWNVASTDTAPVSASNVTIRLSMDDGVTYPYVLAEGTPNDGSESVTMPGVEGAPVAARIMVEEAGDDCGVYFFDVSDNSFTLGVGGIAVPPPAQPACTAPVAPPPPTTTTTTTTTVPPTPPGASAAFDSLSPRRFVDTRGGPEGDTFDGRFEGDGKLAAGEQYRVTLADRGSVPADAKAVIMNITAIATEGTGFVTVHPCVSPLPLASSLNYTPGVNLGNEIIAPLDSGGGVCIFTSAAAHITVDVTGFVDDDSSTAPITPRRFLDTRLDGETFDGQAERLGKLPATETQRVKVANRGGVPADAVAVIANVTAIATESTGFITVDPCADAVPLASSLNYVAGVNRGNEIIASIDPAGGICLFTSATVHLTVDVVGYLPAGTELATIAPGRYLDTRPPPDGDTVDGVSEGEGKRSAGSEYTLQLAGRGDIGANAKSVVMNLTAVGAEGTGFVTVHPCVNPRPNASSLNYVSGVNGGNEIIAQLSDTGKICLFTSNTTHLTVDVVGFSD